MTKRPADPPKRRGSPAAPPTPPAPPPPSPFEIEEDIRTACKPVIAAWVSGASLEASDVKESIESRAGLIGYNPRDPAIGDIIDIVFGDAQKAREAQQAKKAKPNGKAKAAKPKPNGHAAPQADTGDDLTEQEVMRLFVEQHREELRYNHSIKRWLVWQGHYWKIDGRDCAFSWALDYCRNQTERSKTRQKVRFARAIEEGARVQEEVATDAEMWDRDPWLLGTPGGVVDLRTGMLRDGRSEDLISKITRVTPAATEDCPRWLAFLHEALDGKADNIAYLKRWLGYCLTAVTEAEAVTFVWGPNGTGKGTTVKTVTQIWGDYAKTVPVEMFSKVLGSKLEYYRAEMAGKRLIVASEPDSDAVWSQGMLNELTGSDLVSARVPGGRPFDFEMTGKIMFNGNTVPQFKGIPEGIKRRLKIVAFLNQPQNPNEKLKQQLVAEYPGILRWCINGCLEFQDQGLNPPPDVVALVDEYLARQDVMARWIEECCDLVPTYRTKPGALRSNFNDWAKRNYEAPMSGPDFHAAIAALGKKNNTIRQVSSHGSDWVNGIGFKPHPTPPRDTAGNLI